MHPHLTEMFRSLSAIALITFFGPGCSGRRLDNADRPALDRQCTRFVQAVEAYRQQHGGYPRALSDAGIARSDQRTRYGRWQYTRTVDSAGAFLRVGDYGRNLFTLSWETRRGACEWDS